jgi:hypothetical protein
MLPCLHLPLQGNVGTAAYLNVFGSIFRVLKELKRQGYDVGDVPGSETELIQSVLQVSEGEQVGRVNGVVPLYLCCRIASSVALTHWGDCPVMPRLSLQAKEAKFNSSDLNIAYRMKVCRHHQQPDATAES